MKAKFNITLPEVQLGAGEAQVRTMLGGHVETEVEFTIAEARDLYELQKEMMKEAPELLGEFISGLCREFVSAKAKCEEELMKDKDFSANLEEKEIRRQESLEILRSRLAKNKAEKADEFTK